MPLQRASDLPLVTPRDIPRLRRDLEDVSGVFNPGAVSWGGRELLLLRVQTRGRTTVLVPAERCPAGEITILGPPIDIAGLENLDPAPAHIYDPRLTAIDDILYVTLAADFRNGCRLLTAKSTDFARWQLVGSAGREDVRNGVMFPERFGGDYLRLQRPNRLVRKGAPTTGTTITLARSHDLVTWTEMATVMEGRPQRWDEWIGAGPPPVKTAAGWLLLYHGVATHFASANVYQAGVVLLDLEDPSRIVSRGAFNILEPREPWELTGQVPNVVFPTGMIADRVDGKGFADPSSPIRVYYGAADTVVGLATTTVSELIEDARFEG